MATGTPSTEPSQTPALLLLSGVAWILGIRALLLALASFLGNSPLAEAVLGALIVDVASGRAGVAWVSEEIERTQLRKRCVYAGAVAFVAIGLALAASLVGGFAAIRAGAPSVMLLASLLGAFTQAIRDELLLRALPFRFAREAGVADGPIVIFTALLSPTGFLLSGASVPAVFFSLCSGLLFAAIYARWSGAWAAIVAHSVVLAVSGPLVRGGLLELSFVRGELADGALAAGAPAIIGGVLMSFAAMFVWVKGPGLTQKSSVHSAETSS
jgi:hypothetical protein